MKSIKIFLVLTLAIIVTDVHANKEKKNFDDVMGTIKSDKPSWRRFYTALKSYCFENPETAALVQNTKFNRPALSRLQYASNDFQDCCGAIFDLKKGNYHKYGTDEAKIAFMTLEEITNSLFHKYEDRLTGEGNEVARKVLHDMINTDPLKFFCKLSIRRMGLEDDIKAIQDKYDDVSREEAVLRTYILKSEDPAEIPEWFKDILTETPQNLPLTSSQSTTSDSSAQLSPHKEPSHEKKTHEKTSSGSSAQLSPREKPSHEKKTHEKTSSVSKARSSSPEKTSSVSSARSHSHEKPTHEKPSTASISQSPSREEPSHEKKTHENTSSASSAQSSPREKSSHENKAPTKKTK